MPVQWAGDVRSSREDPSRTSKLVVVLGSVRRHPTCLSPFPIAVLVITPILQNTMKFNQGESSKSDIWDYLIAIVVLLAGYIVFFISKYLRKFKQFKIFMTKLMHSLQIIFKVIPENTTRRRSKLYSGKVLVHADNICKLNYEDLRGRALHDSNENLRTVNRIECLSHDARTLSQPLSKKSPVASSASATARIPRSTSSRTPSTRPACPPYQRSQTSRSPVFEAQQQLH